MIAIKPVVITDSNSTSTIPEPDTVRGEIEWIAGTYQIGDKVIKVSTHRTYQAVVVTTDDPEAGVLLPVPSWVDVGPTNKYAMYDGEVGTQTIGGSPLVVTVTPSIVASGVAMFNLDGAELVNVTVVSVLAGEIYNKDINLTDNSNVTDGWTYYFAAINKADRFVLLDIPPYTDTTITVTITSSTEISIGVLAVGPQIRLGVANYNTEIQLLDFSSRERDPVFGTFKTVKRATADLVKFDVTIPTSQVSYVRQQFRELSQVSTVWVGGDGSTSDPTSIYGYYENFVNNISGPSVTKSTITIQGVV